MTRTETGTETKTTCRIRTRTGTTCRTMNRTDWD